MIEILEDRDLAPKTFFVAPDPSVVSETFLEQSFLMGYECYALPYDIGGGLQTKVQHLVESLSELILFFTIDRIGDLSYWVKFVSELQRHADHGTRIGILYRRPERAEMDELIKRTFLLDIGVVAGCVPLLYAAKKNHPLLLEVLGANQANGKRRVIRMRCPSMFRLLLEIRDHRLTGTLVDLSVSHLSVRFDSGDPQFSIGDKIPQAQLLLGGISVQVRLLTAVRRALDGGAIYVFLFHAGQATPGIEESLRAKVNDLIFRHYQSNMGARLSQISSVRRSGQPEALASSVAS